MIILALFLQGLYFVSVKIAAVILNPVLAVDSYPWFGLASHPIVSELETE